MTEKWQPIETAPRDGENILLWSPVWEMSFGVQIGYWDERWNFAEMFLDPDDDEGQPTHWLSLPTPPQTEGSNDG